ncbi:MAG TPA: PDZ domain-containing protein, partial [Candidatus Limnocylindria bacterium]|nr:PDZ domain-containing protein [Candidatus Limnocylindria bacterium]
VPLAGVTEGSPAARAGLRQGDVIIRLGHKAIKSIEDLTNALGERRPGDEVEIIVQRTGRPLTLKAILGSRG